MSAGLHTLVPKLSPLNFRGLLDRMGMVGDPAADKPVPPGARRRAIECWRCPECLDVHDDEDDAERCCAETPKEAAVSNSCPVCGEKADTHRLAADCCLWRDIGAAERWRIADAVEAGATWAEQLGVRRP
jgi:hypothetical protein